MLWTVVFLLVKNFHHDGFYSLARNYSAPTCLRGSNLYRVLLTNPSQKVPIMIYIILLAAATKHRHGSEFASYQTLSLGTPQNLSTPTLRGMCCFEYSTKILHHRATFCCENVFQYQHFFRCTLHTSGLEGTTKVLHGNVLATACGYCSSTEEWNFHRVKHT